MATMRAWQFSSATGGLENNLFRPAAGAPRPPITDDQLLVEVYSMALNPTDYKVAELGLAARAMVPSPCIPGMDFCGKVVEAGSKAQAARVGDMVFGARMSPMGHGSLGQYIAVSKDMFALLPEGVRVDDAASAGVAAITALQAIQPNVNRGDRVFINGGSGGTGIYGIQIAKALGCHVTATCSRVNIDLCKSLGADELLDYTTVDITKALADKGPIFKLAVDNVGSPTNLYKLSHTFLLPDAKFIQVGMPIELSAAGQLASNMLLPSFLGGGKNKYQVLMAKPSADGLEQIGKWLKEGKVRAVLDDVFDFDHAPDAFQKLKAGRAKGKIVVHVQ